MAQVQQIYNALKTANAVMQNYTSHSWRFHSTEQLQKYIDVANEFGAVLKLTASQRIMITNLRKQKT